MHKILALILLNFSSIVLRRLQFYAFLFQVYALVVETFERTGVVIHFLRMRMNRHYFDLASFVPCVKNS